MKPLDIAAGFIEQHARRVPVGELKRVFQKSLSELGIRYFACCAHVDPLSAASGAVVFQTYPRHWVRHFSESGQHRIDPVFRYAEERLVPFFWDDAAFRAPLIQAQLDILHEAAGHGIEHGYTVPIHPPGGQTASCSVVPDDRGDIHRSAYQAVFTMACFMFDAMVQGTAFEDTGGAGLVQLSERERQCLELAAQGKDDWSIGSLLSISERTAHNHIERAKTRLGVCTRVQVIVLALREGQISFGDVIKRRACDSQGSPELRKKAN